MTFLGSTPRGRHEPTQLRIGLPQHETSDRRLEALLAAAFKHLNKASEDPMLDLIDPAQLVGLVQFLRLGSVAVAADNGELVSQRGKEEQLAFMRQVLEPTAFLFNASHGAEH
jgi:hypothetical protein